MWTPWKNRKNLLSKLIATSAFVMLVTLGLCGLDWVLFFGGAVPGGDLFPSFGRNFGTLAAIEALLLGINGVFFVVLLLIAIVRLIVASFRDS